MQYEHVTKISQGKVLRGGVILLKQTHLHESQRSLKQEMYEKFASDCFLVYLSLIADMLELVNLVSPTL